MGTKAAKTKIEERYIKEGMPALKGEFNYANVMQIPRITKVVINTSLKEAVSDAKVLQAASDDLAKIAGQKPVLRRAKKSISNFKLREGQPIGVSVTLRGKQMYDFLTKLIHVALPRVRDFKGVSPRAFDGRGNYTLGITEQLIFPEIKVDRVQKVFGMNVTIVTTAGSDNEGRALLKTIGMPFRTDK